MSQRNYNLLDKMIMELDASLTTMVAEVKGNRPNPADNIDNTNLSHEQSKHSAGLMRINHSGEVCAQALYRGQMLAAHNSNTYTMLEKSCAEEIDHLAWTHTRLQELDSHRSYLNPFWYTNAWLLGVLAGLTGDRHSLGFIEETEKQVSEHLSDHLGKLPTEDVKSRKIVEQMRTDEEQHGQAAIDAGATELPQFVRYLMRLHARVMTTLAYHI